MKISVVIPLYNKELSIQRAINSVLNQTEQDFEIIVVNDGSTDKSAELVANFTVDSRIRLFHQENLGVSVARNRGVAEARSDFIAFLDADDEWLPGFLNAIINLSQLFRSKSVFATTYFFMNNGGETFLPKTAKLDRENAQFVINDYLSILRIGLPFNSSSFAVKKKVFLDLGGFEKGLKYKEDVDFWIRLSLHYDIVFDSTPLAIYHRDSENRACPIYENEIDQTLPVLNLVNKLNDGQVPKHLTQSAVEYIAKYQIPLAKHYILSKQPKAARALLQTCSGTKIYLHEWWLVYSVSFLPTFILQPVIKIKNLIESLHR